MCYQYNVEFLVRKGLGAEWVEKLVFVEYDDVDANIPEHVVINWAKHDAEVWLKTNDCPAFIYINIHSA